MQHHFPILFENIPEETLRWEKLFSSGKPSYCCKGIGLPFSQLEQYVFCMTIPYLRSMAFTVGEQIQFSYAPNQDRNRWNQMVLRVHETTFTTTSEAATC